VSKDIVNPPTARSWRDIPQPVKPRAMSRGGKWRLTTSILRAAGALAVIGGVLWGGWEVMQALQENPQKMPAGAKTVAIKHLELRTDGVLSQEWLVRTLALPKNASLMELDLQLLRQRLMATGQVNSANLTKSFPDTLKVQISERSPVSRLKSEVGGEQKALLVARDGIVFDGVGYDEALLESLPWLEGVTPVREGDDWKPVPHMSVVSELLSRARLDTDHLYRTWQAVSLARFDKYAEIEVRTAPGTTVVFGTNSDFFQQLAKLDYQWEMFSAMPNPPVRIDLSLGRDVAVSFQPVVLPLIAPALPASTGLKPRAATRTFNF
jgi:hypothetical protein